MIHGYALSHENLAEIETAIEQLPTPKVDELAAWLETHRLRRMTPALVEAWLARARGAARPGVTTADMIAITRDE